jgi:hypothetical protein
MSGSYVFLLHIIAFGMLTGAFIPSYLLDRKLRAEQDWGRKMYIGGIMRTFGLFTPITASLLLLTGIGNIHNRLLGAPYEWYQEGWLVAKIILFVILAFNGLFFSRKFSMGRMMLIKAVADKNAPADAEQRIASYNKKISWLFLVQTLLLLAILYLATFGSGKHPGDF